MNCDSQPGLLPLEQALEQMLSELSTVVDKQKVTIEQACGRVLAEPVLAGFNIPPYDNSAMDGYALHADEAAGGPLQLIGISFAGTPFEGRVLSGQTVRIMTGAMIPPGADAVVMQEQVEVRNQQILCNHQPKPGENIRRAGEDIRQGETVLPAGKKLTPVDIGLLASLGIAEICVFEPLNVALFSSGDELVLPGRALDKGQIYDSNRPALRAALQQLGIQVLDLGVVPDDKQALRDSLDKAASQCHGLISSGGVSVGEADFTREILAEKGQIGFWKLAIKPGKPFAFGRLGQCAFFGLPGNPVSAWVTFEQLVLPALQRLSGEQSASSMTLTAIAGEDLKKRPGRMDFQRGICWRDEKGELLVKSTGNQSSGVMTSIARANCYILLEQQRGPVKVGESVSIQLFDSLPV
ncbi:molybdopterin molybdotransferase MoeA [Bowmanella dokdonensis]|uniref:Molybdopterin molybdenumtransferase n=1 Tax=Bowmanella dokdonensis TaxID=751969 RepID=A0A939ILL7_9ALTE|nr:gephyrin-like molybdotransferase Glp [Bowmanella dokdonensis]MBN7824353.1 molybdopterin molybdotransferase MoeA [Bowmanella dokdonensis]